MYQFYTTDAKKWVEEITDAVTKFMSMSNDVNMNAEAESVEPELDVEIIVREVENLRPSPKKRVDNPYFYIGVGNPEHFSQDRLSRKKSNVQKSRTTKFTDMFLLKLTPSKEFMLDIRLYSAVKQGYGNCVNITCCFSNDFSYGVVNVPLHSLFNPDNPQHELAQWFDVQIDNQYEYVSKSNYFIDPLVVHLFVSRSRLPRFHSGFSI